MIASQNVQNAMLFAYRQYADQFDRYGCPYIFHVMHLAEQMNSEKEVLCALLHNVLNDSFNMQKSLARLNLDAEVLESLQILRRRKTESFESYIRRISCNTLAKRVKAKDLEWTLEQEKATPSGFTPSQIQAMEQAHSLLQA